MNNIDPNKFEPGSGLVLLKLYEADETIKTAGGLQLYVDLSYEKERHAVVRGTVVAIAPIIHVTDIIRYGKGLGKKLRVVKEPLIANGDTVYFEQNAVELGKQWHQSGGYFENEVDGKIERYLLIPYGFLICYVRNDEIYSLNNYVVAEQLPSETEEQFIEGYGNAIINKETKSPILLLQWEKHKKLLAKVVAAPLDSGLEIDEIILHEQESDVCIENSYNITLDKRYIYMLVDDIFCTMENGFPMPFSDKVVIVPEPIKKEAGRFLIPESARKQHSIGTVSEIGGLVTDVKPGDRVYFILAGATMLDTGEYMVRQPEIVMILEEATV